MAAWQLGSLATRYTAGIPLRDPSGVLCQSTRRGSTRGTQRYPQPRPTRATEGSRLTHATTRHQKHPPTPGPREDASCRAYNPTPSGRTQQHWPTTGAGLRPQRLTKPSREPHNPSRPPPGKAYQKRHCLDSCVGAMSVHLRICAYQMGFDACAVGYLGSKNTPSPPRSRRGRAMTAQLKQLHNAIA